MNGIDKGSILAAAETVSFFFCMYFLGRIAAVALNMSKGADSRGGRFAVTIAVSTTLVATLITFAHIWWVLCH